MSLKAKLESLLARTDESVRASISDEQVGKLIKLVELLDKWNKAYNLTSVRDPNEMLAKHIVDSLVALPHLKGEQFIDVGTGPGLPGLPLAICMPHCEFVLLDSLGKRIRFIRQVCHELNINNVTAVQSRVEAYQTRLHDFDGVLSRAFASLNDMLAWCHHLPKPSGCFYALKGTYPEQEITDLDPQFGIDDVHRLSVPGLEGERHMVIIRPINAH
ncbi:16S rRNA (guanine(527)-N(7))-methyltransferase [Idiomarina sp. MD25a]|uniref:16S rRNA (guanine(527)-N(7))-methyltransferase RsmG n=1 Tax=Idiomarina sp. MD25a TaxID=1889913 RepID=UPI0008F906C8|nr:16S rRNA (guanine(527)-N(7))-methyltransferase RsmG [Idiomarina sp. MD25a]OIM99045.1 16S rRNA (guanine(527)-N(7))-methyltransferase [Idiomarina sp. MD25a]